MLFALLPAMQMKADTEVYVGKLCFRCYDKTMTAELVENRFCENPVDIIVPQTVESDGKVYTVTAIGDNPFWFAIESVQLPSTIRRIGDKAFYMASFSEFVMPDSIEEIGEQAFYGSALQRVVFPKSLKQLKIGEGAFSMSFLEELELPEGLTELGALAFENTYIESIAFPSTLKAIPDGCCYFCRQLTSITIPEGVEYIGEDAFSYTQLANVAIPTTVKEIGSSPFSNAPITSVTIPSTLKRWPDYFLYGAQIESIDIPEGVTEIGEGCFMQCGRLKHVKIPSSVKFIGHGIVSCCDSLESLSIPSSVEVVDGDPMLSENATLEITGTDNKLRMEGGMLINDRGEDGVWLLTLPENAIVDGRFTVPDGITALSTFLLCGYDELEEITNQEVLEHLGELALSSTKIKEVNMPRLKSIGESAFASCYDLTSVLLPEGVEEIPGRCFENCHNLSVVTLPSTLKKIGEYAFSGSGITSIDLPEGLQQIGEWAFFYCDIDNINIPASCNNFSLAFSSVRTVNIAEGITDIVDGAFLSCSMLEEIKLPSSLKTIGSDAFWACTSLNHIDLPDGLESVGESAFSFSGLTSVVIPESACKIGIWAFEDTPLTYCEIKSPLREIPEGMFDECKQLQQVVLPNTVERFGMWAFWCNFALSDINFPDSLKELGYAAMAGTNIEQLKLPATVERIGEYCFGGANCSTVDLSLTQLKELPGHAFNECLNIKSIILPASMEVITDNFYLSPEIERVECRSAVPPVVEGETFDEEVFTKAMLVVPAGSEVAYRNAEVWKKFNNIAIPTGVKSTFVDSQDGERIYDLNGMEKKSESGIYIKGGKLRIKNEENDVDEVN